jgi:hypothetical protein
VRKSHLNLLAFTARLLEGFHIGQCTDAIAYIFVEVAGDFARDRRRALLAKRGASSYSDSTCREILLAKDAA